MEKKPNESFREYGLRWREQVARVNPLMEEDEMVEYFLQAQEPTYFGHLISGVGKPFNDMVKMGEIVDDGWKSSKIMSYSALKDTTEAIQNDTGSLLGQKEHDDVSMALSGSRHGPTDPYAKGFDPTIWCMYHSNLQVHSIEDCCALKREKERMIREGIIVIQDSDTQNIAQNPLPAHDDAHFVGMRDDLILFLFVIFIKQKGGWFVVLKVTHPYNTRSKSKVVMASKDLDMGVIDPSKDIFESESELKEEVLRLKGQMAGIYQAWISGRPPALFPTNYTLVTILPLSQIQMPTADDISPQPFHTQPTKTTSYPASLITHVFVAPQPATLPRSSRETVFKVPDAQHYALEPTFKVSDPHSYAPHFEPPCETEKSAKIVEQDEISRKVKNLEQSLRNMQGIGSQMSLSYKDLCLFPDIQLPVGFKMPKFD
ncbi:uncharacterized protein [Nicotiana sylvestris]|uniref:uncharacterized protein n=1 Tax=Nicotiana sylvestris TaxID=4096 RepID=UPI00388CB339